MNDRRNREDGTEGIRIAVVERDVEHLKEEQEKSECRIMDFLKEMQADIKKLPNEKTIGLMINNQVHKTVSGQVTRLRAAATQMDWRAKAGIITSVCAAFGALAKGFWG